MASCTAYLFYMFLGYDGETNFSTFIVTFFINFKMRSFNAFHSSHFNLQSNSFKIAYGTGRGLIYDDDDDDDDSLKIKTHLQSYRIKAFYIYYR
jgi:hypothetical protein